MLKKHYKIQPLRFFWMFLCWFLWTGIWWIVPVEELRWPILKWIVVVIFTPIGILLLGALSGYKIELMDSRLRFGYFPYIRTIELDNIKVIRSGARNPASIWRTNDFVTIRMKKGEEIPIPCDNAEEIISVIKPLLS